jgi:uncharacterized membrane protein YjfL (UPF0719 family)
MKMERIIHTVAPFVIAGLMTVMFVASIYVLVSIHKSKDPINPGAYVAVMLSVAIGIIIPLSLLLEYFLK